MPEGTQALPNFLTEPHSHPPLALIVAGPQDSSLGMAESPTGPR